MSKYYRTYYRSRKNPRAYQPISGGVYGGSLKETFDLIVAKFLSLDAARRRFVFDEWAERFGTGTAKNAERAYSEWRSGARGMTQSTRERIAEIVPPYLSRSEKIEIARSLWRPAARRYFQTLTVSGPSDSARIVKAYDEAAASLRGRLAEGFPALERWLTPELVKAVEETEQDAEADARAKALEVRAQVQRQMASPAPRRESTFALPLQSGQQLTVVVAGLSRPIWRIAKPVLRAVTWAAVLGGITAGIYFWPNDKDPIAVRAEYTVSAAKPTHATAAAPRPTATTQAQTRTYMVQPGDSWTLIAARLGVPVSALYAANGLSGPTKALFAGDVLTVPLTAPSSGGPSGAAGGPVSGAPACFVAGNDTCNCSDFATSAGATLFMRTYDPRDVNRLDGDNDGTACDSNSSAPSTSGSSGVRTGAICRDGTRSTATGSGACSHHGGVATWLTR